MKKTKLLLGFLLLLWGGMFSCKSDLETLEVPNVTMGNNVALSNVRTSFENRLRTDPSLKDYKIEPRWDKAVVSNNIIEMPFTIGGKTAIPCGAKGLKNQGRARLVLIQSGSDFTETIVYFIPSENFEGKIADVNIQNVYGSRFSGRVISMKMGSNEWTVLELNNGSVIKKSQLRIITDTKNGKIRGCTTENLNVVWVTWDGQEYVYNYATIPVTVCDDGNTGNGGGGGYGDNGGGNGNGGDANNNGGNNGNGNGSNGQTFPHNNEQEECDNKMSSATNGAFTSDEMIGVNTISESPLSTVRTYEWIILKSLTWHLFSLEQGTLVRTDINSPWRFASLEHKSISKAGITFPGLAVSFTENYSHGDVHVDGTSASINLRYTLTYSLVCSGSSATADYPYTNGKFFYPE
jgi:hypothetical protein